MTQDSVISIHLLMDQKHCKLFILIEWGQFWIV